MGNQNPHNAPPALPPRPWQAADASGVKHGLQASESWAAGESDGRDICDQRLAPGMWRVSIFGSKNMEFDVQYGTSKSHQFRRLRAPVQLYVPGQLTVTAHPVAEGNGSYLAAYALVTCTPVSSAQPSNARLLTNTAGALPDSAARFKAVAASVVQLNTQTISVNVNLASGDVLPLVAGAVLVSGAGFVEYET